MDATKTKTVNRAATAETNVAVKAAAAVSIQASNIRVSSPTDSAEKEADSNAKKIMRMAAAENSIGIATHDNKTVRRAVDEKDKNQKLQRKSEGQPDAGANVAADIQNSLSGGSPLPLSVRRFMEPRFRADFSAVKIHTNDNAAKLSRQLNARAFTFGNNIFFGKGQYQPDSGEGRELIAHELTHTVQQGAAPQRGASRAVASEVAVQRSEAVTVTQTAAPQVQRLGLSDALDYFADKANAIPGFRMFTIILGKNPINMSSVDRSAANILRALIEFIPGGVLVTQALDNYGVFDKVGNWIEQQIRALGMTVGAIKQAISDFLDSLSWRDIFDLGGVWSRAKRIFTEPIDRIINFAKGVITGILKFIKDAILMPLAKLAEGTRGWDLLIAVLGKNPITGDPVPQTADTLIGGFMKLIGQEDVWENMKKSNAIARAWAWFKGAMAALKSFVGQIPQLFIGALQALELVDIVVLPRAFVKVAKVFGNFIGSFISWAGNAVWNLLEIIFDVVSPGAFGYVKKTGAALKSILKNPLPFVGNLVKAAKLGFQNFATNFFTHLKAGLIDWLTGSLPGIYIPKAFELAEIVKFVFSVLGLSWANVRIKLVKVVGETAVKAMEAGFDIVVTLVRDGPAAAWDKIKEQLANLKDMVIGGITDFVVDMVVQKAIPKLIAMFIPGAGFISAILSIYDTIMVFVNKISKIIQVVTGFINSIVAIASGAIGVAANKVETTLAGLLSLAINFLAGFAGLGKVADKIMGVINKVRAPIDKALDALINWIVTMAKKLFGAMKAGAKKLVNWWTKKKNFKADDESHELSFRGEKENASLMVASNPQLVETFVAGKKSSAKSKAAKGAIAAIESALTAIKAEIKKPEDTQDADKITTLFNTIGDHLAILMSAEDWGSDENPVLLNYPKPRLSVYAPIYLGPYANDHIAQNPTLQQISGDATAKNKTAQELFGKKVTEAEWASVGKKVRKFSPTQKQGLPHGEETIGVDTDKQIQVGLKFQYKPDKTKGGKKLNSLLRPYGFRPQADGMDADHVVETQLIGLDKGDYVGNLWPLRASDNRHGLSLAEQDVELPGAGSKTMKLSAAAKKKSSPWIMVKSTT